MEGVKFYSSHNFLSLTKKKEIKKKRAKGKTHTHNKKRKPQKTYDVHFDYSQKNPFFSLLTMKLSFPSAYGPTIIMTMIMMMMALAPPAVVDAQRQMVKMCLFYDTPSGHARSDPIINQNCASGHVHTVSQVIFIVFGTGGFVCFYNFFWGSLFFFLGISILIHFLLFVYYTLSLSLICPYTPIIFFLG